MRRRNILSWRSSGAMLCLRRLRETGLLTEEVWKRAVNEPVRVTPPEDVLTDAPYFVDAVLRQVEEAGVVPLPEGLRIDSTLDPMIQQAATESLEKGLAKLEAAHPHLKSSLEPVQGAVVVLDPQDRVHSGTGGRAGLPAESIQSRRSGAAATGLALQTLRLSCGAGSGP